MPIDWGNEDSGPFCRHWDDLNCEIICKICGHRCAQHGASDGDFSCNECDCEAWVEPDQEGDKP